MSLSSKRGTAATLLLAACMASSLVQAEAAGVAIPALGDRAVPASVRGIDRLVVDRLGELGIRPSGLCSDAVFVRRVHLDVIGTLPTSEEARQFLQDRSPGKRNELIDRLLEREEFADYWAMKWCSLLRVKSEFPINLWPNAVQAYHRWIRTCIRDNVSYDVFVREMLTASGSNFRKPQVNVYRAVQSREPQALAGAVALTFMGVRVDRWPEERLAAMAAFFSRVGYKTTLEWKEEIVHFDRCKAAVRATAGLPDGTTVTLPPDQDPREVFAEWLIRPDSPWFNRNIANRVWSWLLGRGIIHESDDIRDDNPPTNPELLALLERELVASGYDVKQLFRLILGSQTYQRSCVPATDDPRGEAHFSAYPVQCLEAEVLIDAINQVTGTTESYTSHIPEPFTFMPDDQCAIGLADASITSPFLELFGRAPRDTGLESERRNGLPTTRQQLHLLNSSHIRRKIEEGPRLRQIIRSTHRLPSLVDELYLTILSRLPTPEETATVDTYGQSVGDLQRVGLDVAWVLINSAEFQFRH